MPERNDRGRIGRKFASAASGIKGWARGDWDILLVILVLASALRIYFAVASGALEPTGDTPSEAFLPAIAPEAGIDTVTPPLYPALCLVIGRMTGNGGGTGIPLLQAVLSSVSVLLVYGAGRRMFGRRTGLLAAAITAVHPSLIFINLKVESGAVLLFLAVAITALAASRIRETIRSGGMALLSGIAVMLDPVAAFMVPGALLAARRRMIFVIILAAALLPWTVRNSSRMNRFVPVYDTTAYTVSLDKYHIRRDAWRPLHRFYIDLSYVFSRSWDEGESEEDADPARRDSNYIATWAYTLVVFLGTAGMIRHLGKRQLPASLPVTGYITLLIFLTDFAMNRRILLEPLLIIFLAALFISSRDLTENGPARRRPGSREDTGEDISQPIP